MEHVEATSDGTGRSRKVLAVERPQVVSTVEAGRHLAVRLRRQLYRYGVSEHLRLNINDRGPFRNS